MKYDLIVIGAGMAGLIAAAKAREQGLKVLVLAQGQGSLTLTSGAIDLYAKSTGLDEFVKNNEEHPYAKVGLEDTLRGLKYFQEISAEMGYPYITQAERLKSFYLPTAFGTFKPTFLAPMTMAKGDLRQNGDILILGFQELRDFSPSLVAANLLQIRQRHGIKGICEEVKLNLNLLKKSVNAFELASLMDDKETRQIILAKIKTAIDGWIGDRDRAKNDAGDSKLRVGIPAVLGTMPSLEIFGEFETELKVDLFEIPTIQPSMGGIRLNTMIINYLKKIGVKVFYASTVTGVGTEGESGSYEGEVAEDRTIMGGVTKNPIIKEVFVESAGGRLTSYKTKYLILATGGVYGGGIESTQEGFREKIVKLPLNSDDKTTNLADESCATGKFKSIDSSTNLDKSKRLVFVSEKSPAYAKVGVKVDSQLRPVSEAGALYANLYVTGRTLAEFDPVIEKSGHGVAIVTGYKAAKEVIALDQKDGEKDGLR